MDDAVPWWEAVLVLENPQYRFAVAMNRFNTPRVLADRRYAFAVDPWLVPNASKTSTAEL
jgi:hypothetical protein